MSCLYHSPILDDTAQIIFNWVRSQLSWHLKLYMWQVKSNPWHIADDVFVSTQHCCVSQIFSLCLKTGNLLGWWCKPISYRYYMPCSGYYRKRNDVFLCARCQTQRWCSRTKSSAHARTLSHWRRRRNPRGGRSQYSISTEHDHHSIFHFIINIILIQAMGKQCYAQ